MRSLESLISLIRTALAVDLQAPIIINISAQSGCGVDVAILSRVNDGEGFKLLQMIRDVDKRPDQLEAATMAVEAVADGTYMDRGESVAEHTISM